MTLSVKLKGRPRQGGIFRKPCRSRFSSHSPDAQSPPQSARTCFEGPFGEVLRANGPACGINPFRFSTKYRDDETDLVYYGYRYYSAGVGRWLSRDPLEVEGGLNIYAFLGNDAVDWQDYLGLIEVSASASLGLGPNVAASISIKVENATCCPKVATIKTEGSLGIGIGLKARFKAGRLTYGPNLSFSIPAISRRQSFRVTVGCQGDVHGTGAFDIIRVGWDHKYGVGIGLGIASFNVQGGVKVNGGIQVIIEANVYAVSARVEWNGEIGGWYKITGGVGKNVNATLAEGKADDYREHKKILAGPLTVRF